MNKLLTLACCTMAFGTVSAQDLIIKMKGAADPVVIPVADIEYMEVGDSEHNDMQELVEFEVINMGRFSFDVKVKKSAKCEKYVVGALTKNVYNEANFVDAALQTFDETAFYRPYLNSIGTADQVFAERQLGINALSNYDSDDRSEVITVLAVCAFDKEGGYKVYTYEFKIPDAVRAESPTVSVEASNITSDDFTVTVSASDDCKKVIYGITSAEALGNKKMSADLMLSVSQSLPVPYTGPLEIDAKNYETISPASTYYAYAIPIAEDGTIGEVSFTTIKTPALAADGSGKILSASGTLQVTGQYKSVTCPKMTFSDNVKKVRIMWCSNTDFEGYSKRLVEVFVKDIYKNMAWSEYDIDELPRTMSVYHYGDKYYMYAATVDKDGKVSEPQNVLELMGESSPYTTSPKSDIVPDINFNGKATVNVVNDDKELIYSQYIEGKILETNPWFTVTPGENLDRVLVLRIDGDLSDIEKGVESVLVGYPAYTVGEGGVQCEMNYANGIWKLSPANALGDCTIAGNTVRFKERWLTFEMLVFVTIDTDGRPRIAYIYSPDDATLKPF